VPGLSENIRVRSIVGPFLEHSRIYHFGGGTEGPRTYLGSADAMTRNLDGRVEVVVPIESAPLAARIEEVLTLCLADDALAWELQPDGSWQRTRGRGGLSVQDALVQRAGERSFAGGGARVAMARLVHLASETRGHMLAAHSLLGRPVSAQEVLA
jgi:polyphosphate kinase